MGGFTDFIKSILAVRKNSTGSEYRRRRLNFIEGSNVTLTVADDPTDDEVDVTIAASGGSVQQLYPVYGYDGAANFDGTSAVTLGDGSTLTPSLGIYTLNWDLYLADGATLAAGKAIKLNGYRIFCAGTFNIDGTIHHNGGDANGLVGGAAAPTGSVYGGISGPSGKTTDIAGANGTGFGAGVGIFNTQGGNGGNSGTGRNGGTGGSSLGSGPPTARDGKYGILYNAWHAIHQFNGLTSPSPSGAWALGTVVGVAASGGSGGSDGTGAGLGSGAGGGGAGWAIVVAKTITGSGTITAKGGVGGDALGGNSGGGGGGCGGYVGVVASSLGSVTLSAAGGAGGAKNGSGANGTSGGTGVTVHFAS
jgi:hypothetical protein